MHYLNWLFLNKRKLLRVTANTVSEIYDVIDNNKETMRERGPLPDAFKWH